MTNGASQLDIPSMFRGARRAYALTFVILIVSYIASGITRIAPHEAAVVKRWGRWLRDDGHVVTYAPGLLFAWPYPVDEVVRVPIKQERTVSVTRFRQEGGASHVPTSLPTVAYSPLITGDVNYLQLELRVKYRIDVPSEFLDCSENTERIIEAAAVAEVTTTINHWSMNDALRLGGDTPSTNDRERPVTRVGRTSPEGLREALLARIRQRCDDLRTGTEILAVEINEIGPPLEVVGAFEEVQTSRVSQETLLQEVRGEQSDETIAAEAMSQQILAEARGMVARRLAYVAEQVAAFEADLQFVERVGEVPARQRLQRDAWQQIIARVKRIYYVPATAGRSILRVSIPMLDERS